LLNTLCDTLRQLSRDHRCTESGGVFRGVVVPIGVEANFSNNRRSKLMSPENSALQLSGINALFHHQPRVELRRMVEAYFQLMTVAHFADPHRRAEIRWLHKAWVLQFGFDPIQNMFTPGGITEIGSIEADVGNLRQASTCERCFHRKLVHAHC
jgi:hypothetical protein